MTLNAVIALILHLIDFQADYITVVEDRPIMSSTFGQNYNASCSVVSLRYAVINLLL